MSAQPTTAEPDAITPAAVTYLDTARDGAPAEPSEVEALRQRLATERSASSALIGAMAELEQRLKAERESGLQLKAAAEEHELALAEAQEELRAHQRDYARLSYELNHVVRRLAEAERPLWRKMLRLRGAPTDASGAPDTSR